jgi:hypothetical protein
LQCIASMVAMPSESNVDHPNRCNSKGMTWINVAYKMDA